MQYLQKSKIKQNVLEITENVIYDIAIRNKQGKESANE
jgi:hypothetical protein